MIDGDWFARICCLASPKILAQDQEALCKQLGEQEEVLPYLLVTAGAFADWPAARAAFRKALRSVVRTSRVRREPGMSYGREQSRAEMREAIREILSATDSPTSEAKAGQPNKRASILINRHIAESQGQSVSPHVFIAVD
jgi:hypothetical protein